MVDKIIDEEFVEELKVYGEVVKMLIDWKKWLILIKKLNYFKVCDRFVN